MSSYTLIELLKHSSSLTERGITFIEQTDHDEFLSYHDLYEFAQKGLHLLQMHGLRPKDELVFQLEDNRSFVILFWSCILGGIIPVPLSVGKNEDQKAKLFNIWQLLDNPYLVCSEGHLDKIAQYGLASGNSQLYSRIRERTVDHTSLESTEEIGTIFKAEPQNLAFIQFSSGSTGSPKGVMLTHENLITNVAAIGTAVAYTTADSTLSWMPLTHDMGLIGFHINPLFNQMNQYLMPTSLFVRNPTLWLSKASEHRITVICSPNFGYKYLMKYLKTGKDYEWDLSAIRIIYNGAEPISEPLAHEFLDKLSVYQLQRVAMCPVYGLAEASLAVSISLLDARVKSLSLDRTQLNPGEKVCMSDGENALSFVNVGTAINEVSLCITDDAGNRLSDDIIGHVKIKGKNVTAGYYNSETATAKAISHDGWLDTGDLGFMRNDDLFVTGRAKDIFFVNGQNFYPHDLERIGEGVDGVELNKIIISGTAVDTGKEEVIAFSFHRGSVSSFLPVAKALKTYINKQTGVELTHVIPVKDIPKTTSGKLQRFKLMEQYQAGTYAEVLKELESMQNAETTADTYGEQPENETENRLLKLWEDLFLGASIAVTDRFFEIGGNSLKAAELAMRVLREFEVSLTLSQLYEHQSIRELAILIGSLEKRVYTPLMKIRVAKVPISPLQRRLFYFQQARPESAAYNVPIALKLPEHPDNDRLNQSLLKLIERWDMLRTSFSHEGDAVFMQIHEKVSFQLSVQSVEILPSDIKQYIQSFELSEAGQFRATLLKSNNDGALLLLDFHHIIIDGVSASELISELIHLYQGDDLEINTVQFGDYTAWLYEHFKKEQLIQQRAFWLERLSSDLPILDLPIDHIRPSQFDYRGKKLGFSINKAKSDRLRALSTKLDCSMHVILFTAYSLLLHKYTGQKELIIGIPTTVRNHPDIANTPGMFVNNLAISVQIDPSQSFDALLTEMMQQMGEALSQDYPFDWLLDDLGLKREPSRNPLFDTMFVYQNMDMPTTEGQELSLQPVVVDSGISKFDISQELFDTGKGPIHYSFEYATALFQENTIQRMAAHFDITLERLLSNPYGSVKKLSILSVAEYQNQLFHFNDTDKAFEGEHIVELFQKQVLLSPQSIALECDGRAVTYEELNQLSNAVAKSLLAKGLQAEGIVAIYLNRSIDLVVSLLGVMKAGGGYLPIDIDLPTKRVDYLLADSKSQFLITHSAYQYLLSEVAVEQIQLLVLDQANKETVETTTDWSLTGNTLAYVLYTSGTTGNPKGVKISHRALHNYISWASTQYLVDGKGNFPLFTSISFDLTVTSLFVPLVSGSTLFIYDDKPDSQEHLILQVLKENRADVMKLTPSHLRLLRDADLGDISGLKLSRLIIGGEALESSLVLDIQQKLDTELVVFNEYGPTETTVGCMIHTFQPTEVGNMVPIGVPAANTKLYLLDEYLQVVPVGVKGELYVSGTGLAQGYLFNEVLTAERFIQSPFATNERLYKTGDLAIRLPDGNFEFLGRRDEQIKLNGYRIEPDEITQSLRSFNGVKDVVVSINKSSGKAMLYAYVQPEIGVENLSEALLKGHLAQSLPFYMIPGRVLFLDEFPLTGNGKVDFKALATLKIRNESDATKKTLNSLENDFLEVWQSILGTEEISVSDNFFELGGDSIKAVQIVSRLHEKGVSVQVKDVLTYHSIEGIIANEKFSEISQLADQASLSGNKAKSPIEDWFFAQEFSNPSHYHQSVYLKIERPLDLALLEEAFELVINHHDGLRLNFDETTSQLFFNEQHLTRKFKITEHDDSELIHEAEVVDASMSLNKDLLWKAIVFKRENQQSYLYITAHHLVTDGLSWRILLHDLSVVYGTLLKSEKAILPTKTSSLTQWQEQLSQWQSGLGQADLTYWDEIKSIDFSLPLDEKPDNWNQSGIEVEKVRLSKEDTRFLTKEAFKTYNTDVFTLLNVALARALNQWKGICHFVVEHENHGRHLDGCDVSRTVGWFTALYPVSIKLEGEGFLKQIMSVKEQMKAVPHHGLSYPLVKELLASEPSEMRLNYLGEFKLAENNFWSFSDKPNGLKSSPDNHLTTKLELNAMVMNEVFSLEVNYHSGAFRKATMQALSEQIQHQLVQLLNHAREEQEVHFTPSDFEAELDQQDLDDLFN